MVKGLDDLAPEGLLDRARKAAGLVDDAARVRIFCHYDPDGTTSASILARALMRRGKRIHATMAHALDGTSAARLQEESNELLVVSDMGSGQLDLLESLPYPVVVLDHHKPIRDSEKIAHVNPHFFGVDGAREMCGSTTTWLFALVLDERNWDLAGPAMAGAIGDKQALGGFVGVNAALFDEAKDRKVVVPDEKASGWRCALGIARRSRGRRSCSMNTHRRSLAISSPSNQKGCSRRNISSSSIVMTQASPASSRERACCSSSIKRDRRSGSPSSTVSRKSPPAALARTSLPESTSPWRCAKPRPRSPGTAEATTSLRARRSRRAKRIGSLRASTRSSDANSKARRCGVNNCPRGGSLRGIPGPSSEPATRGPSCSALGGRAPSPRGCPD